MPTISLVPRPPVQPAAYPGVGASPAAATAPTRALGAVAQGISQVGQAVGQYAERQAHRQNVTDSLTGQMAMEKTLDDFQQELDTDKSIPPDKWVELYQQKLIETKGAVLGNQNLSPQVRDQLTAQFSQFEQRTTAEVQKHADVRKSREQQARGTVVVEYLARRGEMEGALAAVDQMNAAGVLSPEDYHRLATSVPVIATEAKVDSLIASDPILAEETLTAKGDKGGYTNFQALTPDRRLSLIKTAEIEAGKQRADTMQAFVDQMDSGQFVNPQFIDKAVDEKRLLPTQARWLKSQQVNRGLDPSLYGRAAELGAAIHAYDPSQPNNEKEYWHLWGESLAYPADMREELQRQLKSRKEPTTRSETTDAFAFLSDVYQAGGFGDIRKTSGLSDGPRDTQTRLREQASIEEASRKLYEAKVQYRQWLEGPGKNSTPEQQMKFIQTLRHNEVSAPGAALGELPAFNGLSGFPAINAGTY